MYSKLEMMVDSDVTCSLLYQTSRTYKINVSQPSDRLFYVNALFGKSIKLFEAKKETAILNLVILRLVMKILKVMKI